VSVPEPHPDGLGYSSGDRWTGRLGKARVRQLRGGRMPRRAHPSGPCGVAAYSSYQYEFGSEMDNPRTLTERPPTLVTRSFKSMPGNFSWFSFLAHTIFDSSL